MSGRITPELSADDETHTLLSTTSNSKQQQQQQHPVVQQQVNTSKAAFFLGLPTNVKLILFNELTERFAYYGNRAILTLFLTHINFDDAKAVMVYSLSSAMAYTMPLFGGYLADAWLGRYWTIVIFSMVYFFGALLLALAAVPSIWDSAHDPMLVYIALTLTAFGTGGIKANVSTFGGEQLGFVNNKQLQKKNKTSPDGVEYAKFKNIEDDDEEEEQYGDQQQEEEEQQHNITPQMTSESFFYMFYFTMNIGSIGATILIPLIRTHVSYFWAFLLPAGFMLLSVIILLIGLAFKQFHLATPDGGVVVNSVFTVIYRAFKRRKWLYQDYLIPLPQGFAEQMAKRYANTTQPDLITVDRTAGGQDHTDESRGEVVEAVVNVHDFTRFVHLNYDFILRHHYHNHTAEFDYDKPSWLLQAYTPGGGGDLTTGSTTTMTTSSCCAGGDGHDTLPTVHSSINAFETTAGSPRDRPQRFTNKSPIATAPKINYGGVCQCESGCSCSCCESKQQTPNGTLKTTPYQTATGGNLSTMAPAYDLRSNADAPCRCNHQNKQNNNNNNNNTPDDDNMNNEDENNAALLFSGPASGPYGQGIKHPYEINQNIQKEDLKATSLYYYDQEDEETAQSSPNTSNSSSQNRTQQNFYQQHASFGQKVEDFDTNKSCLGKFFSFVFCCCSRQYRRLNEVVSVLDITSDEYNVLDHLSPEILKSKSNFNRKNNNNTNNNNNNIPQGVISIDDLHFPLYYDSNDQPDYLNTSKKYQHEQDKSSTTTTPSNKKITYSIINSIRICLVIIPVLCTLPVFWSLMNQQGSTWMVQAEEMKLKFEISLFGKTFSPQLEPEQMSLLNPIFLAVFLPVLEYFLRINHSATTKNNTNNDEEQDENEESKKKNVEDDVFETKTNNNKKESWFASPLNKIFLGMMFAAIAYIFAAGVDIFIQRGKDATPPYKINIMWQSFQYFFVTMAEVMISVTGLNFVFDMAPSNVKSLVTALYLFSSACGDLLTGILYSTFETWGFTREMMFYGFAVLITVNSAGVFVIKYVYEALYKQQLAIANNY